MGDVRFFRAPVHCYPICDLQDRVTFFPFFPSRDFFKHFTAFPGPSTLAIYSEKTLGPFCHSSADSHLVCTVFFLYIFLSGVLSSDVPKFLIPLRHSFFNVK